MGLLTTNPLARNAIVARASNTNQHNGLLFRIAAYLAAVALIACGASQNVAHGWALGSARSEFSGYILAGGALAAAVMSPVCLSVAFTGRGFLVRLAALFLGAWCLAYGLSASLGFIATAKDGAISERLAVADAGSDRKARFDLAKRELGTLKGQSAAVLTRRRELERIMAETSTTATSKTVGTVDPQAAALAGYMTALGWTAAPDMVSLWTTAFATAFYEIAGAFALTVARATGSPPAGRTPSPTPDAPAPEIARPEPRQAPRRDDDDDRPAPPPPRPKAKRGRRPTVEAGEVLDRLRKSGGQTYGSLQEIGRLIGTGSKTATHRLLHRMASAGLVHLDAGRGGVRVAVAGST
jgi:hypothetical protein